MTSIRLDGSQQQSAGLLAACGKLGFLAELKVSHGYTREMWVEVEHEKPMDLFVLGATYAAMTMQLSVSSIKR